MPASARYTGSLPADKPPRPEKEPMTGARASALKRPVSFLVSTI